MGSRSAQTFRDLQVYTLSFELQQAIYQHSRHWPKEETYSLIDQIRRSSRSIGANIAEAWSKRRYPAHFLSKLTDSDGENQETQHWIDTAHACGYLTVDEATNWKAMSETIGRKLGSMINKHESFCRQ